MDASVAISKRVTIPFVDPPVVGTPISEPEAGLKAIIPAMSVSIVYDCTSAYKGGRALMPVSMFWFAW